MDPVVNRSIDHVCRKFESMFKLSRKIYNSEACKKTDTMITIIKPITDIYIRDEWDVIQMKNLFNPIISESLGSIEDLFQKEIETMQSFMLGLVSIFFMDTPTFYRLLIRNMCSNQKFAKFAEYKFDICSHGAFIQRIWHFINHYTKELNDFKSFFLMVSDAHMETQFWGVVKKYERLNQKLVVIKKKHSQNNRNPHHYVFDEVESWHPFVKEDVPPNSPLDGRKTKKKR